MYNLDNIICYPGKILNKVVSFDPLAWDEITAHADWLFEEQRRLLYLETDKARPSNLLTRLKNFAVRSYNEAVKVRKDPYLRPAVAIYASVSRQGGLQMTSNMVAGLLTYVERNKERLIEGAGISHEDILDLRIFCKFAAKMDPFAPAKNI